MQEYKNKRILVTGGTGSIGSEIVRQLLLHGPAQVRVFSRDESRQAELVRELNGHPALRFLIGDIRDRERLMLAMENVDIVFHAAAMKHVDACERNPFEAIKTNVHGTQNVIDCAFAQNVEKVIGISTDKAANPTNVMGTSKLLAEKLMLSTYFYKGNKRTKFSFVRFGNVLWSRGSALPLFLKAMRRGDPINLTDPSMTRFFMSIESAVRLVFRAASLMQEREIFVFKMPAATMGNVVAALEDTLKEDGVLKFPSAVRVTGKKEGERSHEKLLTEEEAENALETDEMFIIRPDFGFDPSNTAPPVYGNAKPARHGAFISKDAPMLSLPELKKLISEGGYHKNDGYKGVAPKSVPVYSEVASLPVSGRKVLAVILARGGSKSIPKKNIIDVAGKPLLAWTIEAGKKAKGVSRVVVSSDDEEILEISSRFGAEVIKRPKELATDTATSEAALWHAVEHLKTKEGYTPDIIILLQPTSPLRTHRDIESALSLLSDEKIEAVISAYEVSNKHLKSFVRDERGFLRGAANDQYPFTNRQGLPKTYMPNGAIWIIREKVYRLSGGRLFASSTAPYLMEPERSTDIDSLKDLQVVESQIRRVHELS